MGCPLLRPAQHRPLLWSVALVLTLAFLPSAASQSGQAENEKARFGMSLTPVTWTVRLSDGQAREVQGIAARGVSLRPDSEGEIRPLRALLMPALRDGGREAVSDGSLEYGLFLSETPGGQHIGIELEVGAALLDLAPPADRQSPAVRRALEQGRLDGQVDGPDGSDPRRVRMGFFPFWPMILTHSAVAGAEGTRLVVIRVPQSRQATNSTVYKLVEGAKAMVDWQGNEGNRVVLSPDRPLRLNAEGRQWRHATATREEAELAEETLAVLQAGWAVAFPGEK